MTTTKQAPERIDAAFGSRLGSLAAQYVDLELRADEINAQLEVCKDAIKVELTAAKPGATDIYLHTESLETPLRCYAQTTWRLDSALKAQHPTVYVRFAKQTTSWVLRQVNGR